MEYLAQIRVTLRPSILDPQGKAAQNALVQLGFEGIRGVRIGKFVALRIEAASGDEARATAEAAADRLLANPVMEDFEIEGVVEAVSA